MIASTNSVDLQIEGQRIWGLLRKKRCLTVDDLKLVTKIIDDSEARGVACVKIYGAIFLPVLAIIRIS